MQRYSDPQQINEVRNEVDGGRDSKATEREWVWIRRKIFFSSDRSRDHPTALTNTPSHSPNCPSRRSPRTEPPLGEPSMPNPTFPANPPPHRPSNRYHHFGGTVSGAPVSFWRSRHVVFHCFQIYMFVWMNERLTESSNSTSP